jgi:histidine triad (HIT) family protein
MPISKEQSEEIKKQLLSQVERLPQENKEQIKSYIQGLNEEELEEFLKQNKIQLKEGKTQPEAPECVFCSIIKGDVPSHKIAENKKAIVILEINPLSKGHSIVLPLKHANMEEIPKAALTLAQKIAKKIKKKLKAEDVKIETSNFQGHSMINIIPIYKDTPIQKKKADEKELKQLQNKLETKTRAKRKKDKLDNKEDKPSKPLPKVSFRVP